MQITCKIYNNDFVKSKLSSCVILATVKNSIGFLSTKKSSNLAEFFDDITVNCSIDSNGLVINEIDYDTVKIKSINNVLVPNGDYKFGIRKSYVATIDKNIVNKVTNFYGIIRNVVNVNNKVVFDASKETRLQDALNTEFVNPNSVNIQPTNVNVAVNNVAAVDNSRINSNNNKIKGQIHIFWLCIFASIIVTTFGILIGIGVIPV